MRSQRWLVACGVILSLLLVPIQGQAFNPSDYVTGTQLLVPINGPFWQAVFFAGVHPDPAWNTLTLPPFQWHSVDLSALVPPETTAVILSGIIGVVNPTETQTAAYTLAFRAPGSTLACTGYVAQAIAAYGTPGVREPFTTVVPVVNQHFEVCYQAFWGWTAWSPAVWGSASFPIYPNGPTMGSSILLIGVIR